MLQASSKVRGSQICTSPSPRAISTISSENRPTAASASRVARPAFCEAHSTSPVIRLPLLDDS